MANGSVITTHLLDGDPQGIRRVFIKNKTCEMYIIPRTSLADAKTSSAIDLKQPSLYILLENLNSFNDEFPQAYIGHAEDFDKRIDEHLNDKKNPKDFFQVALVFVSRDHSINKADIQFLEYTAINDAKSAGRYDMSANQKNGSKPHLTPDQQDVVDEFKDFVWLLTSFAGCKIFTPHNSAATASSQDKPIFYLHWDGIEATALYGNGEMEMLKGSQLRKKTVPSARPERREKALQTINYSDNGDGTMILLENTTFTSPSRAAWMASGTALNGWDNWKNADGQTLNQIYGSDKSK